MKKENTSPVPAQQTQSVRKAVEAIAINPRTGKVTLLTRKLFNVLLHLAQKQGDSQVTYRAALGEITSNASFDSNDTSLIKEHLRKMNAIQVEWNSTSPDGNRRWGVTNLLAEAEIIEDRQSRRTWVEWSYSPKIKKRLLEPEIYARLSLQFQSSLRSSSSLALYEICSRYTTSPNNLTMRQAWEWWRPVLTGVPEGSEGETYQEYKYFKRDVLKGAVAELNAVTDLDVDLIEHKNGRRIESIQFRARKKAQSGLPLTDPGLFDMSLVAKMMALGLSQREVEQIYGETEENVIRAALGALAARQANKRQPPVESPGAWFKTALKSGLTKLPALPQKSTKPKITPEKIRERYLVQQRDEARSLHREMREEAQIGLGEKFREFLESTGNTVVLQEFKKKGLKSKIAETAFFAWMAEQTWGSPTEKDLLEFVLNSGEIQ